MKKITLLFFVSFLLFVLPGFAQKNNYRVFRKGQIDATVGVGLLPTYLMDHAKIVLPPLTIGADYMVSDIFSLGLQIGYSASLTNRSKDKKELAKEYENRSFFAGIRMGVHCTKLDDWDFYGGFNLGYYLTFVEPTTGTLGKYEAQHGIKARRNVVSYNGYLGIRHSCCGKISFFAEIGYGVSILHAGIGFQL